MKKCLNSIRLLCTAFLTVLLLGSCEEFHIVIGYVKNNTKSELVSAEWGKVMADSLLCQGKINLDYYLQPGLSKGLYTSSDNKRFRTLPDSAKQFIYIFNSDSLKKYQHSGLCDGIVRRCLVKKIEIQLNKVKKPFDTVFVNSSKPIN
ncbi:MAG: hypothetical protein ACXVJN_15680 [Mucilaginibacter sp.]